MRLLRVILMTGVVLLVNQATTTAGEVAFRFDPPDGTRYVETVRVSRTRSGGGPGVATDAIEWRRRIEISRTPEGYVVTATPLSVERQRDGAPAVAERGSDTARSSALDDPVLAAWAQESIHYDLDAEGRLLRVRGCEVIAGRLQEQLAPQVAGAVAETITPEALAAQEMAAWNERIGWLVGRSAAIGEPAIETAPLPLPDGGSAMYDVTIMPIETAASGVRVQVIYSAQAGPALAPAAEAVALVSDLLASGRSAVIKGAYLSGSVERVVDPAMLLPMEETATRLITLPIEAPEGGRTTVTFDEQLRYTFEYES